MVCFKLVLLSLLRNKRRTLASVGNLSFALSSVLLLEGFAESMYEGLRESLIRSQLGHIQVFSQGFNQYGSLNDVKLFLSESVKQKVIKEVSALPGVMVVTARLETDLLVTDGESQISAHIIGIDPDKEAVLSSAIQVTQGSHLFPERQEGVLLGKELACALKVKVGDTLTLLGSTATQTINAMDVSVLGIITTGVQERDLRTVYANIGLVEHFLLSKGATRVVILLDETKHTIAAKQQLIEALNKFGLAVELRSWSELAPYYHQVVQLFDAIFTFVKVILFLGIGFSVSHTLSMNVVERTREIGVIRAMGASRAEIIRLFLLEGGILGLVGGMIGLVLALVLVYVLNHSGLMMPTPPGNTVTYPLRILITPFMLGSALILSVLVALLCSLLPAMRAGRLTINSALHHA